MNENTNDTYERAPMPKSVKIWLVFTAGIPALAVAISVGSQWTREALGAELVDVGCGVMAVPANTFELWMLWGAIGFFVVGALFGMAALFIAVVTHLLQKYSATYPHSN